MRNYLFYIEDSRYSVSTLLFVQSPSERHAREFAAAKLAESTFYVSVTIWDGDREVAVVTTAGAGE